MGEATHKTLGLVLIAALAVLGGSPAVRQWERRAGIAMMTGTGIPFLLLGALAGWRAVGILDEAVLRDLRPVVEFALGWIGFRGGTEFDLRKMDAWPEGTGRRMLVQAGVSFLAVTAGVSVVLVALGHRDVALQAAVVLGACGAVSSPSGARALERWGVLDASLALPLRRMAMLDDVVAVGVLALMVSIWRPVQTGGFALPPLGWLFVQVGMGVVLGGLLTLLERGSHDPSERFAFALGAVAFTAGMAGYLGFSPMGVCLVAGAVVANIPTGGDESGLLQGARTRALERSVYLTLFVILGAQGALGARTGIYLLPVFILARVLGKRLGVRAALDDDANSTPEGLRAAWVSTLPPSVVSVAVVVGARQAYPTLLPGSLETVAVLGALCSELVFHRTARRLAEALGHRPARATLTEIDDEAAQ